MILILVKDFDMKEKEWDDSSVLIRQDTTFWFYRKLKYALTIQIVAIPTIFSLIFFEVTYTLYFISYLCMLF